MNSFFPTTAKELLDRIRRYERLLRKELNSGHGGDGYGKRFWLGPMYMLLDDVDGALKSYEWYEREFPDDSGEPWQYLTWALALHKGGEQTAAFRKLYQTMLMNLYLVPHLLGEEPQPHGIWHGCNLAEIEYSLDIPEELLELWDEEALQWAREVVNHPLVVDRVDRHIAIHHQLLTVRPSPLRTALVEEAFQLSNFEF